MLLLIYLNKINLKETNKCVTYDLIINVSFSFKLMYSELKCSSILSQPQQNNHIVKSEVHKKTLSNLNLIVT